MSTCKELNNKQFVVPFMKTGLNYFFAHIVQCCVIVAPDLDNTLNNVGNKTLCNPFCYRRKIFCHVNNTE